MQVRINQNEEVVAQQRKLIKQAKTEEEIKKIMLALEDVTKNATGKS